MSTKPVLEPVEMAPVPPPMVPEVYRVRHNWHETHDVFTLELEPSADVHPRPYEPGQFNMLYAFGVGEVPISISGDPAFVSPILHTIRAVGPVTKALRKLRPGDTVGVRGPFGNHWPVAEAAGNDVVILAGGIGLAPLRSALYYFLNHREKFGSIVVLYGTRTPDDILYRKELERWRSRFDLNVNVTVDRAAAGWHGQVGVVTTLIGRATFDPVNTIALICGPEVMMRFTVIDLQKRGVDLENIYVSMERNMKCAVGLCGHCQFGPKFICRDGPVFRYDVIQPYFAVREI